MTFSGVEQFNQVRANARTTRVNPTMTPSGVEQSKSLVALANDFA